MTNSSQNKLSVILCFDPLELEAFKTMLGAEATAMVEGAASPYFTGSCYGFEVGLIRLPFGNKVDQLNTAIENLFNSVHPAEILINGTAMGLNHSIPIGELCLTTHTESDLNASSFNEELSQELFMAAFHHKKPRFVKGYTSAVFVNSEKLKEVINQQFPRAEILEMEDLHIAKNCRSRNIPCASLRLISDYGNFDDHMKRLPKLIPHLTGHIKRFFRARRKLSLLTIVPSGNEFKFPFNFYIKSFSREIRIPLGVTLAAKICHKFNLREIASEGARIDLFFSPELPIDSLCPSFSSKGFFRKNAHFKVWLKSDRSHLVFWIAAENLEAVANLASFPLNDLSSSDEIYIEHSGYQATKGILPIAKKIHIQGLNSISAEAEEGLLAAATTDEFQSEGYLVESAEKSNVWVYRTANSSEKSYFDENYETPFREIGIRPDEVYCIATGLGPSIDPAASGGYDAGTLMLGDEQGGRLLEFIEDLSIAPFKPEDVFRYPGVIQRIGEDSMAISRIDQRLLLSSIGINNIPLQPSSLRKVYSEDYDKFLKSYFPNKRREKAAKGTFLLLTSRGCGNECSICCSGGYIPFTPLSIDRTCEILLSLKSHFDLKDGEYIEIFLLDSNFNKRPTRVINIADRLEKEGMLQYFEFFIRHNGLQAFLIEGKESSEAPLINEKLINAYQKLGIDEIVIGIDSYTDVSIQLLKTNFNLLKTGSIHQPPSYRFKDIVTIVQALENAGMKSRGFLLMNNPFVSSSDRIQTFFNLLLLSSRCKSFIIDFSSSLRVNELKPFHGAPITKLAHTMPGVMSDNKFHVPGLCSEIEQMLRFDLFHERRINETQQGNFIAAAQETRFGLCDFLYSKCRELPEDHHATRNDVAAAAYTLINEEKKLPRLLKAGRMEDFFQKRETEISLLLEKIDHELKRRKIISKEGETAPQTIRFFQALDQLE